MGFPRHKRKGEGVESCRFTTGAIRAEADRHHVTLPRLGRIHSHESTRKLVRRLEQGTARIISATLSRHQDRWHVSFTCEVSRTIVPPRCPTAAIGVDVGVRHLAVLSDGRLVPNPAPLLQAQRRLRRLDRQLAYKTAWAGTTLVEAGPFYPSSKTCCGCGRVKAKLPPSEREYRCEHCGMVLDRDLNAARNLAMLVDSSGSKVAGSGPETPTTPVDGDAGPCTAGSSSMKREAGTEPLGSGQTGTAGW